MTPGWGRHSWAEEPFKLMTAYSFHSWDLSQAQPTNSFSHHFISLIHCQVLTFRSTTAHISKSARNLGNPGLCQRIWERRFTQSPGTGGSLCLYFPGVEVGGFHPHGFGSRHVCSEQVRQASQPDGNYGVTSLGHNAEPCEIPFFPRGGEFSWRIGMCLGGWWPRFKLGQQGKENKI